MTLFKSRSYLIVFFIRNISLRDLLSHDHVELRLLSFRGRFRGVAGCVNRISRCFTAKKLRNAINLTKNLRKFVKKGDILHLKRSKSFENTFGRHLEGFFLKIGLFPTVFDRKASFIIYSRLRIKIRKGYFYEN